MKKLFTLTLALIAISSFSFAQKIDVADRTNIWYILVSLHVPGPAHQEMRTVMYHCSDTFVHKNGKVYTQVNGTEFGNLLIRTDTLANKTYYYRWADSSERILFDYNLQSGDSFLVEGLAWAGAPTTYHYYIAAVDSIYINTIAHKRFWLNCNAWYCFAFAEGIGYLGDSPFYLLSPVTFINWHNGMTSAGIVCFVNNGGYPSISPGINTWSNTGNSFDNIYSCNDTTLSIWGPKEREHNISINPQPALTYAKFHLPNSINEGSITITDLVGRIILQNKFQQKQELQIDNPGQGGVYFYHITDNENNRSYSGKVIFR